MVYWGIVKKILHRHTLLFLVMSAVCAAPLVQVLAVRPDERDPGQMAGRQFPAQREVPRRAVTPSQLQTAGLAAKDGVLVEWNSALGTPRSVRGSDLAARRPFSGGKGLAVKAGGRDKQDAIAVLDNLAAVYGIRDAGGEFIPGDPKQNRRGSRHIKAQQIHKGLRVIGGEVVAHFGANGAAYQVNGTYIADIAVATAPQLTPAEALNAAQRDLSASGNPTGTPAAEPELIVFAHKVTPRLAYTISHR